MFCFFSQKINGWFFLFAFLLFSANKSNPSNHFFWENLRRAKLLFDLIWPLTSTFQVISFTCLRMVPNWRHLLIFSYLFIMTQVPYFCFRAKISKPIVSVFLFSKKKLKVNLKYCWARRMRNDLSTLVIWQTFVQMMLGVECENIMLAFRKDRFIYSIKYIFR